MPEPLSVVILEDNPADFELVTAELRRSGFVARCERVETEAEYIARLDDEPDIILADYVLAGFSALRALEILQMRKSVIPFIVLTGAVSEETVVECMKRGAADYLLKDRVLRLGPAVTRALEERKLRLQKLRAEQELQRKNIELEEQYRQVQAASRMKSIFLANMSHELRTPLTAIIGFTELLVDGKVGDVPLLQLDLLQDVLANGRHLLDLINDVLDFARVESGSMQFRPQRTWISETVGETVAGLRVLAEQKKITVNTEIRVPFAPVLVDPQRLKQVLLNYLSNALKFTRPGGVITVRATPEGESAFCIEVEDTGIGIREEDIGRLFQDFQQLDDTLAKGAQGTGLGLALTKRLVEAQGGSVGVTSTVGRGSTFFAVLPFTTDSSAEAELESEEVVPEQILVGG